MLKFLRNLFQVLISPDKGWEDISYQGLDSTRPLMRDFYLFIAIAVSTIFVQIFYESSVLTWKTAIFSAAMNFTRYIISYYISYSILISFFDSFFTGGVNEVKIRTFVVFNLSIIAIFDIIGNIEPGIGQIIYILPLYLVIVTWAACRYLLVESRKSSKFTVLAWLAIVVPVTIVGFIMDRI